jgi:hypothetical protein
LQVGVKKTNKNRAERRRLARDEPKATRHSLPTEHHSVEQPYYKGNSLQKQPFFSSFFYIFSNFLKFLLDDFNFQGPKRRALCPNAARKPFDIQNNQRKF